jgi:hypothetical protein
MAGRMTPGRMRRRLARDGSQSKILRSGCPAGRPSRVFEYRRASRQSIKGEKMPSQKYLLLHRSPVDQQPPSPARMQEMFAVWNAWKEKFQSNVVDMGGKLRPSGKVLTASGVMDGPFVETKEIVGGYMIVSAESYDHALEMAREMFAMMGPGTRVEIRELAGP